MKKVFVGGSKGLKTLSPAALSALNRYLAEGAEFLVGDCAGADALIQSFLAEKGTVNVTVYTILENPRKNAGNWAVKKICPHNHAWPFLQQKEKDSTMAEDADCAFIVWDGESKGTFLNILEMLKRGKPVSVLLSRSSQVIPVTSYAELEPYVSKDDTPFIKGLNIEQAQWHEVLEEFMPSEFMRTYLKGIVPSKEQLRDLICFSPVSVYKKLDWLKRLAKQENLLQELLETFSENANPDKEAFDLYSTVCCQSFAERAWELQEAVDALQLKQGEMFYLRQLWYDVEDDCARENAANGRMCRSLEHVLSDIDFAIFVERMEDPEGEDFPMWHVLEKWVPDQFQEMKRVYRYYLVGNNIYFVRPKSGVFESQHRWSTAHFIKSNPWGWQFHLPIPAAPGDLIVVDRWPFRPPIRAVVLATSGGEDEKHPLAFFKNSYGEWKAESLNAFFFSSQYVAPWEPWEDSSFLYPVYYLRPLKEPLNDDSEEEATLKKVSEYIGGSEEGGMEIWRKVNEGKEDETRGLDLEVTVQIEPGETS